MYIISRKCKSAFSKSIFSWTSPKDIRVKCMHNTIKSNQYLNDPCQNNWSSAKWTPHFQFKQITAINKFILNCFLWKQLWSRWLNVCLTGLFVNKCIESKLVRFKELIICIIQANRFSYVLIKANYVYRKSAILTQKN